MALRFVLAICSLMAFAGPATAQTEYRPPSDVGNPPPLSEPQINALMRGMGYAEDTTSNYSVARADPGIPASLTESLFCQGHYAIVVYPVVGCPLSAEFRFGPAGAYMPAGASHGVPVVYVDTTGRGQFTDVALRIATDPAASLGCPFRLKLYVRG